MTPTERIAAAIKPIIDEDRRADRERIAELERDLNTIRGDAGLVNDALGILDLVQAPEAIAGLNKQLDELTEKCAALVVENKRLLDSTVRNHSGASLSMLIESELKASQRAKPEAPALRIDPDISDPQPGKLLVVRLDVSDVDHMKADTHPTVTLGFFRHQFVGFLVETPAVKDQGPWVVFDETCDGECFGGRSGLATPYWSPSLKDCATFDTHEEAESSMRHSRFAKTSRIITLAEARAIEAKR